MAVEFVDFPDKAQPLTVDTALAVCEVAGNTFRGWQETVIGQVNLPQALFVRSTAWLSESALNEAVVTQKPIVNSGTVLAAWSREELTKELEGVTDEQAFEVIYAWDLLRVNELLVGALSEDDIQGNVSPSAIFEGKVKIGAGTKILPGVFIEGNVVIGENGKIGPNCYIRGNTSIGDNCHIGQSVEIKNSLIMSGTNVGHLSYVGDSVLGAKANFGAGTMTSNLRHDNSNHHSLIDGELVNTGRRKFGVIIGNGVHTGINTSFYPGRKMWPNTTTLPAEVVSKDKSE